MKYKFLFSVFQNWIVYWFFFGEIVAKRFINACVCDSSCKLLRWSTGKIVQLFKLWTIRVLLLLPQNEIQLLSTFFCYWKLVCLFGFWLRHGPPREWKLNMQAFTASTLTSLTRFEKLHRSWAWVIITDSFASFEFCCKLRRNFFVSWHVVQC